VSRELFIITFADNHNLTDFMKKLSFVFLLMLSWQLLTAQQLPIYSQYLYNKFLINPAHAGSDGFTSWNLTAREQWVGYSGAPRTYSLSWQTRLLKKPHEIKKKSGRNSFRPKTDGRVGLGAYVFSDRNGLIQRTGFQTAYSYHMWVDQNTQVSLGLAFTGYHFRINVNETSFEDPSEPWLTDNLRKGVFVPDADFGIYLLNKRFDFGFSAQQLFGAAEKIGSMAYRNFHMDRHFYTFGSYYIPLTTKQELEPSVLVKVSEALLPQADIGLTYIYDQTMWTGLTYRTGGGVIANVRMRYVPKHSEKTSIFIGYAFDFTLNQIQRVTYGTHELTMAIKFGDSARKFRWLDRY
jgi:type IX secretion system PorP/SprF family membrane protein